MSSLPIIRFIAFLLTGIHLLIPVSPSSEPATSPSPPSLVSVQVPVVQEENQVAVAASVQAQLPEMLPTIAEVKAAVPVSPEEPVWLNIPTIQLDTRIVPVNLTAQSIVDTPASDIGWYRGGTRPGNPGNATLNGHTPGIFSNVSKLKVGDELYITDSKSQKIHFRVTQTDLVKVMDFPLLEVYGQTDKSRLNLITCAGSYDEATRDYSHRTIVYSERMN